MSPVTFINHNDASITGEQQVLSGAQRTKAMEFSSLDFRSNAAVMPIALWAKMIAFPRTDLSQHHRRGGDQSSTDPGKSCIRMCPNERQDLSLDMTSADIGNAFVSTETSPSMDRAGMAIHEEQSVLSVNYTSRLK